MSQKSEVLTFVQMADDAKILADIKEKKSLLQHIEDYKYINVSSDKKKITIFKLLSNVVSIIDTKFKTDKEITSTLTKLKTVLENLYSVRNTYKTNVSNLKKNLTNDKVKLIWTGIFKSSAEEVKGDRAKDNKRVKDLNTWASIVNAPAVLQELYKISQPKNISRIDATILLAYVAGMRFGETNKFNLELPDEKKDKAMLEEFSDVPRKQILVQVGALKDRRKKDVKKDDEDEDEDDSKLEVDSTNRIFKPIIPEFTVQQVMEWQRISKGSDQKNPPSNKACNDRAAKYFTNLISDVARNDKKEVKADVKDVKADVKEVKAEPAEDHEDKKHTDTRYAEFKKAADKLKGEGGNITQARLRKYMDLHELTAKDFKEYVVKYNSDLQKQQQIEEELMRSVASDRKKKKAADKKEEKPIVAKKGRTIQKAKWMHFGRTFYANITHHYYGGQRTTIVWIPAVLGHGSHNALQHYTRMRLDFPDQKDQKQDNSINSARIQKIQDDVKEIHKEQEDIKEKIKRYIAEKKIPRNKITVKDIVDLLGKRDTTTNKAYKDSWKDEAWNYTYALEEAGITITNKILRDFGFGARNAGAFMKIYNDKKADSKDVKADVKADVEDAKVDVKADEKKVDKLKCNVCGFVSKSAAGLVSHKKNKHKNNDEKKVVVEEVVEEKKAPTYTCDCGVVIKNNAAGIAVHKLSKKHKEWADKKADVKAKKQTVKRLK